MIINNWQAHGMGMATAVLWQEIINGKVIKDIRLHHHSCNLKDQKISQGRGAVHLHSFNLESVVLEGTVMNIIFDYTPLFEPATAIGPKLWNCWRYPEPVWISTGELKRREVKLYRKKTLWKMPSGQFHYFYPYSEKALTIVRRTFVDIPNDVLTFQGEEQDCSPPMNGRQSEEANKALLLETLVKEIDNFPENPGECEMQEFLNITFKC